VFANNSGPDKGIEEIDAPLSKSVAVQPDDENFESLSLIGLNKWDTYHHRAYGISCTLYESNLLTNQTVGNPIGKQKHLIQFTKSD
jgi:hypothetical protein